MRWNVVEGAAYNKKIIPFWLLSIFFANEVLAVILQNIFGNIFFKYVWLQSRLLGLKKYNHTRIGMGRFASMAGLSTWISENQRLDRDYYKVLG